MHDLRDGLANIKFVEKEEPTLDNGKTFWSQDPYNWYVVVLLRDVIQFCLEIAKIEIWKIESYQNWKLPKLKVTKTVNYQNWKLPNWLLKLKVAKIAKIENC